MKQSRFSLKVIFAIITFTVLLFCLMLNLSSVWKAVQDVFALLAPVTIGVTLAFILNVPMRMFEDKVFSFMKRSKRRFIRKLLRPMCLLLSIILLLSVLTLLIVVVLPDLRDSVVTLTSKLPKYFNDVKDWVINLLTQFDFDTESIRNFTIDWKLATDTLLSILDSDDATNMIGGAASWVSSFAGSLLNIVFSLVIAIYFLLQKEIIANFMRRLINAYAPEKVAVKVFYIASLSNSVFSNFIRSQCIEAVILGLLSYFGMLIFGFEYAGIISTVIGFTALVPIVGALVGEVFGAFLLLTVSPLRAVLFLVFILTLQQLEGALIYPKVVGTSVGLPGIIVFSAVLIGGNAFGIPGALLAVPVCAVLFVLLKESVAWKLEQKKARNAEKTDAPEDTPSEV